jgi:hypothetical protein
VLLLNGVYQPKDMVEKVDYKAKIWQNLTTLPTNHLVNIRKIQFDETRFIQTIFSIITLSFKAITLFDGNTYGFPNAGAGKNIRVVVSTLGDILSRFQALESLHQLPDGDHQLRSGTQLAAQFFNRTFIVDMGRITINSAGSRLTSISLRQFDNNTGKLEVNLWWFFSNYDFPLLHALNYRLIIEFITQTFLVSVEDDEGNYPWHAIESENWFGGTEFPPNEPRCGYLGQASICQEKGMVPRNFSDC